MRDYKYLTEYQRVTKAAARRKLVGEVLTASIFVVVGFGLTWVVMAAF